MDSDLTLIHLTVETVLAGLVWLLYRRLNFWRQRIAALETEQGLIKKRFEAATTGLHIRLLHVERQVKQAHAPPPGLSGAYRPPQALPALRGGRTRGEIELLMKVRQLGKE